MSVNPYAFGGSTKQVRRTQQRFVRWFNRRRPVLDIGCGRGVFLQLLRECGVEARGIDTYPPAVASCMEQGFIAELADALDYLPVHQHSFGGIFCSHVIEHLPFDRAAKLIELMAGALVEDGVLVVVTPNSRDLGVMGETFWLDPTHVRPYPIRLLTSMAEEAGLEVVDQGAFHGGLPKREWPRALLYRAFLGPFHGRPNAYVVARRPS